MDRSNFLHPQSLRGTAGWRTAIPLWVREPRIEGRAAREGTKEEEKGQGPNVESPQNWEGVILVHSVLVFILSSHRVADKPVPP